MGGSEGFGFRVSQDPESCIVSSLLARSAADSGGSCI